MEKNRSCSFYILVTAHLYNMYVTPNVAALFTIAILKPNPSFQPCYQVVHFFKATGILCKTRLSAHAFFFQDYMTNEPRLYAVSKLPGNR